MGGEYYDDDEEDPMGEEVPLRDEPSPEEVGKVWSGKGIANHPYIKQNKNITWDAKGKREMFFAIFGSKKKRDRPTIETILDSIFDSNIQTIDGVQAVVGRMQSRVNAYKPNFFTLSLKDWAMDAAQIMLLLHKQHCQEDFCHCQENGDDLIVGSDAVRKTILVRNLIELFDACYAVAKSKLLNENDKQDKANKRAANIAKGIGGRSATWDESRVSCILYIVVGIIT